MKGYPKTINTRHDFDVALSLEPEKAQAYLDKLKEEVLHWVPVEMQELEDDTHKIVEIEDLGRQQYELVVNESAKYFKLGFNV